MSENKIVWSDNQGDLRKKKENNSSEDINPENIILHLRRLTTGKGRTIIEITNLPSNKNWNKKLAKDLKKKLGVGGAYKNDYIEIHGEKRDSLCQVLDSLNIKYKKTGG